METPTHVPIPQPAPPVPAAAPIAAPAPAQPLTPTKVAEPAPPAPPAPAGPRFQIAHATPYQVVGVPRLTFVNGVATSDDPIFAHACLEFGCTVTDTAK